tara:strand:- start:258 stop:680 length:423 start_codon:yes stop_codon:yes gene_type:complete
MKKFPLFFAVIFLFIAHDVVAHGGHKKETAPTLVEEEPSTMDPMYANQEEESDPLGKSDLFSPSDLFIEGEIVTADPVEKNSVMKMEASHNEHAKHQMPKVENAKHKMVDTSSKGYGSAIGVTLFAGLIFAGLTFIRPGE